MRKSQIESKIDQELQNAAKDQAIKTGLLETFSIDDNKGNFESENNNNLDLSNIQSYVYAV